MPPTVILIRHGEADHNATQNWDLLDPPLTKPLGEQQCVDLEEHLRNRVPLADKVEAIITSPLTRTVQTTLMSLDWLIKRGVKVETDALWQENSAKPCDTGSERSVVSKRFPEVNFTDLDPVYPSKAPQTVYAFTRRAILARGETCLKNLYPRKEKVIAVVSHSGFLRTAVSHRMYANADFRVFTFAESAELGGVHRLVESDLTSGKGGLGRSDEGDYPPQDWEFPPEEQMEEIKEEQGSRTNNEATQEVPE